MFNWRRCQCSYYFQRKGKSPRKVGSKKAKKRLDKENITALKKIAENTLSMQSRVSERIHDNFKPKLLW